MSWLTKTEEVLIDQFMNVLVVIQYTIAPQKPMGGFKLNYGRSIKEVTAESEREVQVSKLSDESIEVVFASPLLSSETVSLKVKILLEKPFERIGDLNVLTLPSSDLERVSVAKFPYLYFTGFAEFDIIGDLVILSDNLTRGMRDRIRDERVVRVEISTKIHPKFNIEGEFILRHKENAFVKELMLAAPQSGRRNKVTLKKIVGIPKPEFETEKDQHGNIKLKLQNIQLTGEETKLRLKFEVTLNKLPQEYNYLRYLGSWSQLYRRYKDDSMYDDYVKHVSNAFELNHPDVIKAAKLAIEGGDDVFKMVQFAMEATNRTVEYKIVEGRKSSSWALDNKVGDCSELSYVMVALLRALGIPSRVVEGYVVDLINPNGLEGHAWVEFLTPFKGWVETDPTWGILIGTSSYHIRFLVQTYENIPTVISSSRDGIETIKWRFHLSE